MSKRKIFLPLLALTFLISCGDKQPPSSPTTPSGLGSGGITPIEPIGGEGGLDCEGEIAEFCFTFLNIRSKMVIDHRILYHLRLILFWGINL